MMSNNQIWLLLVSLYAAAATWALCRWGGPIARRYALMDIPDTRKLHAHATPLVGGLAILAVVIPIMPILMVVFDPAGIGNIGLTVLGVCTIVCALIGTFDDRHSIPASLRLIATLALFASAIAIDPRFLITEIRFTGAAVAYHLPMWAAWAFTLTILLGFLNAVNMADGKNGLMISICLFWCLFLSLVGPTGLAIIMLPIAAMLVVLLAFNLNGRVFLGDGGAYGLAAFFALTAIYSYNIAALALTADMLTLFFIIPGLDMMRMVASRLARGQSPMVGDREHFHHYLFNLAGWPGGLMIYLSLIIIPSAMAIWVPEQAFVILMVTMLAYVALLALAYRRAARQIGEVDPL